MSEGEPDEEEGGEESIEDLFKKGEPAEAVPDDRSPGEKIDDTWEADRERSGAGDGDEETGSAEEGPEGAGEGDGDEDDGPGAPDERDPAEDGGADEDDGETPSGSVDADEVPDGGAETAGVAAGEEPIVVDDRPEAPGPSEGEGKHGGRLSTGIEALDHHLGGGIPPGRIVSFVATADTQSELLVKQLASQHHCLYLSTLRPKWEVEEDVTDYIQKQRSASGEQRVQIEQLTADSRLDAARRHVEELDRRSIVVIDSANELESSEKDRYAYFIDEVKRALWDTGSVGLFYCIEEEQPPAGRAVTLRRADVVWRLRQSEDVGGIRHELLISKFRGGRALIEPLTLWLTDEVLMDDGSAAT